MKHNDAVIRQYCRAVGKRLPLPAAQRRQLLTGLREELTESAPDCTTLDALIAHVGTPDEAAQFAASARENGFGVLIAAAGMAAHLAGALAARTTLPVIGVPMSSATFQNGMDALLSTVQMPSGIPVACVAVNGAVNAALLSVEILAAADEALAGKLEAKRRRDTEAVLAKNAEAEQTWNS